MDDYKYYEVPGWTCTENNDLTIIFCPFCRNFHFHGNNADGVVVGPHCGDNVLPGLPTSELYRIVIVGTITRKGFDALAHHPWRGWRLDEKPSKKPSKIR